MRRIRLDIIIPVIFLLVAAFILGCYVPDVLAAGGDLRKHVASLEMFPQRLESMTKPDPGTESAPLPLIKTYSSVMERLKSDYYGQPIKEQKVTYDAVRGTLHSLGDPFTRFLDPEEYKKMREENEGTFAGIGAQLDTNKKGQVYIKEPMDDSPAKKAGIKANDVIIAVDGKPVGSKDIEKVVSMIRGPEGTRVKLTLQRPGKTAALNITIIRQIVEFRMVKSSMVDPKNKIGYIRLYQFNEMSDPQFDKALATLEKQHMQGLIFDLRGNPGGLLQVAVDIGSRFIENGPVVTIQERGGQKNPLYVEEDKHNHKRYPLVVLVDKRSASASEIVSGAIKDDGVGTLVGTTTFGKGRVQTITPLSDGSAVAITTAKYLTPKGTDIHKKGIAPDIYVEAADNFDPDNPKTDVQLTRGIQVIKVKLGLLPKSVLDKLQKSAKAK